MSTRQRVYRRGVAVLLMAVLALLVSPPAAASAPLPGYPCIGPTPTSPATGPAYEYDSADALGALAQPPDEVVRDAYDRPQRDQWGTYDNLVKNWYNYDRYRVPALRAEGKTPLTWEQYRDAYIRMFNSAQRGRALEKVSQSLPFFDNGDWRFNQKLPDGLVNRGRTR